MARFFTKTNDNVKGPYDDDAIRKSVEQERLSPSTLVRGEHETDFVSYAEHPHFREVIEKQRMADAASATAYRSGGTEIIRGSFGLGFCAGFFGGCIGCALVYALAKGAETKKGALAGFIVQAVLGIAIRLVAMTPMKN